jgi:DNA-binding transcriptional MerR regulator
LLPSAASPTRLRARADLHDRRAGARVRRHHRAIRFYEDCGLLEPARSGRNRVYSARDRTRLRLTLRGKRLGLKLAEVKELVDMYETRRDTGPQLRRFLGVLARHRAQLEQRLGDLQATLAEVTAQEEEARRLLGTRSAT